MPHYFFNLENHNSDYDDVGVELGGPDEARIAAVVFAGEYLRDNPGLIWDGKRFVVEARDDTGTVLLKVTVAAEDPGEG